MRLVLAGCGHAHLFVLEALARGRLAGASPLLISPAGEYFYSGMIPGVIAGAYAPAAARLLPAALAAAAGADWVESRVVGIEPAAQRIHLENGPAVGFDALSLDIGSALSAYDVPGARQHAVPVKPMREALRVIDALRVAASGARPGAPARILVVGGGAAGTELSFCLHQRLQTLAPRACWRITIIEAADGMLSEYSAAFRSRAAVLLAERGIEVRPATRITEVREGSARTACNQEIPYDVLLWATGPRAHPLLRESGMRTTVKATCWFVPPCRRWMSAPSSPPEIAAHSWAMSRCRKRAFTPYARGPCSRETWGGSFEGP